MVHNIVESLSEVLVEWAQVVEWLISVNRLLVNKFTRDRLLETCFARPPYNVYRADYRAYCGRKIFSGRWGTVLDACKSILPLEASLRAAWSLDQYRYGLPGGGHDRAGEGSPNLDTANKAITSPFFVPIFA